MSEERKVCPACETGNAPEARFCQHCGQALVADDKKPPATVPAPPWSPPRATAAPRVVVANPYDPATFGRRRRPSPGFIIGLVVGGGTLVLVFVALIAVLAGRVSFESVEPIDPAAPRATPNHIQTPVVEAPLPPAAGAGAVVADADAAIDHVMRQPKLQEWLKLVAAARAEGKKRTAQAEVTEEDEGGYVVHVFESVADEEPGHTATFGWYRVDKATGEITDANAP